MPKVPLESIQAYVDWRNFDTLPHSGGVFDQPRQLMNELRYIDAVWRHEQEQREQRMSKKTARKLSR